MKLQLDNYYLINKGEISYGESFHDTTKSLRECLSRVEKWLLHTTQHVLIDSETRNPLNIVQYLQLVHHMYYNMSLLVTKGEFYHNKMK